MDAAFDPGLKTTVPSSSINPSPAGVFDKMTRGLALPLYNASRYMRQGDDFIPVGSPSMLGDALKKWDKMKGKAKLKVPEVPLFKDTSQGAIVGSGVGYGSTFLTGLDPMYSTGAGAGLGAAIQRPATALRKWGKFGLKYGRKIGDKAEKTNITFGPTTVKRRIPYTKTTVPVPDTGLVGGELLKNFLFRGEGE